MNNTNSKTIIIPLIRSGYVVPKIDKSSLYSATDNSIPIEKRTTK